MYDKITATGLSRLIRQSEVKPSEAAAYFLSRIREDGGDKVFNHYDGELVLKHAKYLDGLPITPETPPLFGVPIVVKDNICTCDMPTTCSSMMLAGFQSPFDATAISRLKKLGVIIVGKTGMDEFGLTSLRDGTSEAVAAGFAPLGLASDTGGTARLPALRHGLVGYRPSYGAVSRYGLIAQAGSFDQMAPICRTVVDAAFLASAISGHDPRDATTHPHFALEFSRIEEFSAKGRIIGVLGRNNADITKSIKVFEDLGAEITGISLPSIEYSALAYHPIAFAETSSNFSRFDGVRFGHRSSASEDIDSLYVNSRSEGFGFDVKKQIIIGTYILSNGNYDIYYRKARILQGILRDEITAAFDKCDVILMPVCDEYIFAADLVGLPAITLHGVQFLGEKFGDEKMLGLANILERSV